MKYKLMFLLLIFSILNLGAVSLNHYDYSQEGIDLIENDVLVPDFTLKDLQGNDVSLSDYRGKVILLNFWASWCPPCKSEMPSIESLHNLVSNEDIVIVTVNLGEKKEVAEDFINTGKYTFDVLLDSNNKVGTLYSVRSIPSTYIIDKNGFLRGYKVGAHEWDSSGVLKILRALI